MTLAPLQTPQNAAVRLAQRRRAAVRNAGAADAAAPGARAPRRPAYATGSGLPASAGMTSAVTHTGVWVSPAS